MWYYSSQIIKTPKAMQIGDLKYSKALFKDTAKMSELGIKPYSQVTPDSRYYHNGAYTVDTSGDEVVGTYAGTARTVSDLTANMLDQTKDAVATAMERIDWYWVRASKSGGEAVPSAIATYSDTLYTEYAAKKTEIDALDTLAKVIEYENRAYTEVRKDVKDDGTYHASDTTSSAREINMVTHYTRHPDDVDAGLVSLTAD
jgi:hypothetical protein